MEERNKKIIMDGIRRNSGNARRVFGYAEIRRMKNGDLKNTSPRQIIQTIKNKTSNFQFSIFNFQSIFNVLINQCYKIIKFKNLYFISNFAKILFGRNFLKKLATVICIVATLTVAYFQNYQNAQSASYTWGQTTWVGGATANNASHATDQTGWTQYSAKDAAVSAGTEVSLTTTAGSITQTNDGTTNTGFNLSGNDKDSGKITVSGSGNGASVVLEEYSSGWNIQSIDVSNDMQYTSLQLDSSGYPVVSYYDSVNGDLKIIHCNDVNCTGGDENTQTVDSTNNVGRYTSLQLDSSGYPVISYQDVSAQYLKIVHCNDANCAGGNENIQTVDVGSTGFYTSLQLDSFGYPVVSYLPNSSLDLKIVHCNDANCAGGDENIQTVDSAGSVGYYSSLQLDSSGYPVVSYLDFDNGLKIVHCNDANCVGGDENIQNIVSSTSNASYTSLQLDSSGYPVVSYYDSVNGDLKIIHCNDANCTGGDENTQTVDSTNDVGRYASLQLDLSGYPVISYQDDTNDDLKLIRCNDANCAGGNESIQTVDSIGIVGLFTSLQLDAFDYPVMSYLDDSNNSLKMAHANPPAYYSSGTFTSGAVDTGQPNESWGNLSWTATGTGTIAMKARTCSASDCTGATEWASCSNISSGSALGTGGCATAGHRFVQYQAALSTTDTAVTPSLDEVTLGYNYYANNQSLTSSKYDTSDAANVLSSLQWTEGTTSAAETQTALAQLSGGTNSQTAVSGTGNTASVSLAASDPAWASTTVDTGTASFNAGQNTAIVIGADDYARITEFHSGDDSYNLKFIQCTNTDCSTKNITLLQLSGLGNADYGNSLALGVDGFARISYQDNNGYDLKFIQCTSADCSTRNATTVDSTGSVGAHTSIALGADGFARISYYDSTNTNLKFVQCTNADCSTKNPPVTVDSTDNVGQYTSLVLGADGFARISYYDTTNTALKFVQCTNADCSTKNIQTVDSPSNVGMYSSLKLGADGYARISYYDVTNANLKFVQCTNTDCSTKNSPVVIDATDFVGTYSSLVIGVDDYARISYYDWTNTALKFVQCTNANCSTNNIQTVDAAGAVGAYTSLAFDSNNLARIAYADGSNYSMKMAYEYPAYYSSGTFTSGTVDTGQVNSSWGNLSWTATGTGTIAMKARTCSASDCAGATDWASCSSISSGSALGTGGCATVGHRYAQYQAALSTANVAVTPSLDDVTLGYTFSPPSANADVKFQLRTSADGNTWTSWMGTDGTDATYFSDASGGDDFSALAIGGGGNDRWIQYKTFLTSDGEYVPVLTDVTPTYVVNAMPSVSVTSAVQNSDGTLSIGYTLSDADDSAFTVSAYADLGITLNETLNSSDTTITVSAATLLPTAGTIMLDSEQITYTGKSGNDLTGCTRGANSTNNTAHTSGAIAWAKATTATGNIGASQTAGSGKTIAWTINTDYDGVYRNASQGKIRVSANDGDAANQVGNGESSTFVIDTKNPTGFALSSIDHSQNQIVITAATEDSDYEMYVDNATGTLFDTNKKTSPLLNQASSYPNTYTYTAMTSDPAMVYVGVKDAKGNTAYAQMTTPAKPSNPVYYDISSEPLGAYQEFIAWDVVSEAQDGSGFAAYKVYRKINSGSYALLATVSSRTTNYYLDKIYGTDTQSDPTFNPNSPSTYTYKITTTDTAGNVSAYSSEVSDAPNGTGGSDTTAPTISNVTVSSINTTSATVTWSTDELASSYVGYSTDTTYLPERGLASMVTSHSITLTGLDSATAYNLRVKSYDALGNLGQNDKDSPGNNDVGDFTFSTLTGPEISSVTVDSNNTNATVAWVTTTDADTYVVYSDTVTNGALVDAEEVGTVDLVGGSPNFNHSQTVSAYNNAALVSGATYYFYVKSTDASDVTAIDNNGGNFYSFSTTQDDDAPEISGVSAAVRNNTQAVIAWTTNEGANSTVNYGTTSGNLTLSGTVATYDRSHYVILSGLSPNTTYYYTVTSADINTNSETSIEYSFTTLRNPEEQHNPLSSITMLYNTGGAAGDPKVITDTKAVIAFNTDQAALCTIEYGTISGSYAEVPVLETDYNKNHSMHITGLIFSTKYYYRITCEDNLETVILSAEYNFTTSAKLQTSGEWGAGQTAGDATAPEISGVGAGTLTGESVTIKWNTNEKSSSYVRYGISAEYGSMAGSDLINISVEKYATDHSVIINSLIPSTKYYYTVISVDAAGNIGESGQNSFTTKAPSDLTAIKIESKTLGEAQVTWSTAKDLTSIVDYGLTTGYSERKESSTKTKKHEINLTGLQIGKTYHLRVQGKDGDGNLYSSSDYTFDPKSPPQISNISIADVSENSAKITFTTSVPSDTLVVYADINDEKNSGSQGSPEMVSSHEIELKNLASGTTYGITIKVRDEQGNETENASEKFITGKDENPPEITQNRTDAAIAQGDKVQVIISWLTNEPANTSLLYKEGRDGQEKEVKINGSFTDSHIAVITAFKSGALYYYKMKSADQSGNETLSGEYAILTPRKKENIIQVITNNFQEIFKWARF